MYNLIRGTNPAPGAWTTINGSELNVYDCVKVSGDGVAGKVIEVTDDGVTVQSVGGRILIKRVKPDGGAKVPSSEWAASVNLAVGDVLGT